VTTVSPPPADSSGDSTPPPGAALARTPPPAPRRWRAGTIVAALLCAAPVPGDIGSCAQPVQRLDAPHFFDAKQAVDCRRCAECGIPTSSCRGACDASAAAPTSFPDGCEPLVHDGEVCLRALLYASCDDYAGYMDDQNPQVPTECDFCPRKGP